MELHHLETFVTVAEELSFTRAARRLHLGQSGVSAAVKALERELGVALLDRSPRRVALTDAGAALLPRALETLDAAQAARDAVSEIRGGLRGTINVGTMTAVELLDVPALLGDFHARHPGVVIRLGVSTASGSAGLIQQLLNGSLDIAFLSLPLRPPAGIRWHEIAATPIVLVVRDDHRLAESASVRIADVTEEDFVDFPLGYGNRTAVDHVFASRGIERHVTIEVADMTTAAHCIVNGLGIAFIPSVLVPPDPRLRAIPVVGDRLRWNVCVATSSARRPSAAVQALLDLVARHQRGRGQ